MIGYAGAGNVTILPQGSVHYIANTGCYPAIVVSGFNHESPGAMLVSQAFAAFDEQTYSAAFGEAGVTMIDSKPRRPLVSLAHETYWLLALHQALKFLTLLTLVAGTAWSSAELMQTPLTLVAYVLTFTWKAVNFDRTFVSQTTKSELLKQAFEGYLEETKSSS